jgi:hypothetical protein
MRIALTILVSITFGLVAFSLFRAWWLNRKPEQVAASQAIAFWARDEGTPKSPYDLEALLISIFIAHGVYAPRIQRERMLHALSMCKTMLSPLEFEQARIAIREMYMRGY